MTVREMKALINAIAPEDDDCIVLTPISTDLPGVFAFEQVCPGVTGMVMLGPSPGLYTGNPMNHDKEIRALIIAPHSFHEDGFEEDDDSEAANRIDETLN